MSLHVARAATPATPRVDRDIRIEAHWNPGDEQSALDELDKLYAKVRHGIEASGRRHGSVAKVEIAADTTRLQAALEQVEADLHRPGRLVGWMPDDEIPDDPTSLGHWWPPAVPE